MIWENGIDYAHESRNPSIYLMHLMAGKQSNISNLKGGSSHPLVVKISLQSKKTHILPSKYLGLTTWIYSHHEAL